MEGKIMVINYENVRNALKEQIAWLQINEKIGTADVRAAMRGAEQLLQIQRSHIEQLKKELAEK